MKIAPRARGESRWASRAVQAAFVLALVGAWYVATNYGGISSILLPNPVAVYHELTDVIGTGEFVEDLRITLTELLVAFSISSTLGATLGYLISRSQYSIRVFEPLFAGIYSVPVILFLPLYILGFGLGPPSKIAIGTTVSFFPIVLNTIAGFGTVDRIYIRTARSMGASDLQLFRFVLLPAAFPVILTGLRIGFTVALLSILGSETIASLSGLGHRIVQLGEGMDMARMFAYIAFAVAIALVLNTVTSTLETRAGRR
jgi:ABC-type nitrate/sulfonate/bicarbonate transport system permease component